MRGITTSGTVEAQRNTNGSRYYVLADARQDLVVLRPSTTARRFAGDMVVVSGRFGFDPQSGRTVQVVRISRRG